MGRCGLFYAQGHARACRCAGREGWRVLLHPVPQRSLLLDHHSSQYHQDWKDQQFCQDLQPKECGDVNHYFVYMRIKINFWKKKKKKKKFLKKKKKKKKKKS